MKVDPTEKIRSCDLDRKHHELHLKVPSSMAKSAGVIMPLPLYRVVKLKCLWPYRMEFGMPDRRALTANGPGSRTGFGRGNARHSTIAESARSRRIHGFQVPVSGLSSLRMVVFLF